MYGRHEFRLARRALEAAACFFLCGAGRYLLGHHLALMPLIASSMVVMSTAQKHNIRSRTIPSIIIHNILLVGSRRLVEPIATKGTVGVVGRNRNSVALG